MLVSASQPVLVRNGNGEMRTAATAEVARVAPAFYFGPDGGVFTKTDYSLVTASNPVRAGDQIWAYGTGFGAVAPPVGDWRVDTDRYHLQHRTGHVTVGGREARVLYSLASPGYAGLDQVLFEVPSGVSGNVPVQATMGSDPFELRNDPCSLAPTKKSPAPSKRAGSSQSNSCESRPARRAPSHGHTCAGRTLYQDPRCRGSPGRAPLSNLPEKCGAPSDVPPAQGPSGLSAFGRTSDTHRLPATRSRRRPRLRLFQQRACRRLRSSITAAHPSLRDLRARALALHRESSLLGLSVRKIAEACLLRFLIAEEHAVSSLYVAGPSVRSSSLIRRLA